MTSNILIIFIWRNGRVRGERGVVLVVSLILIVILSLLGNLCISSKRMCLHMRAGCGSIPAHAAI